LLRLVAAAFTPAILSLVGLSEPEPTGDKT
jgi:hypothetical protein